ncbi:MAG: thioredoxin-like domain-containing protein [Verrucomicrobiota bacterium]
MTKRPTYPMSSVVFLFFLLLSSVHAEFKTWKSQDGREAIMQLVRVFEQNGEIAGEFDVQGGPRITLLATQLSPESAQELKSAFADQSPPEEESPTTAFSKLLDGNLETLQGKSLRRAGEVATPKKYYVFFYTASWCGYCQDFSPDLVAFYNENKNENFEIVLITRDSSEDAMEEYAFSKSMPWPHLKLRKVEDFEEEFSHGVNGIPAVMVCKTDGTLVGNYRSNLNGLKKLVQ